MEGEEWLFSVADRWSTESYAWLTAEEYLQAINFHELSDYVLETLDKTLSQITNGP